MDKITREELMKKLNLTEEELEKIAGGMEIFNYVYDKCIEDCMHGGGSGEVDCEEKCLPLDWGMLKLSKDRQNIGK